MHRSASLSLTAVIGVLLSGCFMSEGPKLPLSSAVAAFGEGGNYGVLAGNTGGRKSSS
jgi:hypothetical protein